MVEEARAYDRLASEFNLRQEDIARKVGKSRASVANAMRLLDLDAQVQSWLTQERLSVGHAKVLLGVKSPEEQKLLAEVIIRQHSTVRAAEKLVAEHLARQGTTHAGPGSRTGAAAKALERQAEMPPVIQNLQNRLREHLATHRRPPPRRQKRDDRNRILRQRRPPAHPRGFGRGSGGVGMTPVPSPVPPVGVEVLPVPSGTLLRRRWYRRWVLVPIFFALGWDVYAAFFYRLIVGLGPVPAVALFFPVAGLCLAVLGTYAALAAVLNRTEITVSAQGVKVDIGPLPWLGNKAVPATQIRAVEVRLRFVNRGVRSYRVLYLDPQRRERSLLRRPITREWAEFVATTIRQHFRLPPPVG